MEDNISPLDVPSALSFRLSTRDAKVPRLDAVVNRPPSSFAFGRVDAFPVLREMVSLVNTLNDPKQEDGRKRAENTVLQMATRHHGPDYLSLLPMSISAPLRESARTCQLGPPADWPICAYEFVGRNDLTEAALVDGDLIFTDGYRSVKDHLVSEMPNSNSAQLSFVPFLSQNPKMSRKTYRSLFEEAHRAVHHGNETVTGVELDLADFTDIRFGQDRRLQEVARMLRSSNIPSIRMIERPELT